MLSTFDLTYSIIIDKRDLTKESNRITLSKADQESLWCTLKCHKIRSALFTIEICVICFVNLKREWILQKNKIFFIVLFTVTAWCTLVNQNHYWNHHVMSNLSRTEMPKRMNIAKHCWKESYSFNWNQKKVVDGKSRLIPKKTKETKILWVIPIKFTIFVFIYHSYHKISNFLGKFFTQWILLRGSNYYVGVKWIRVSKAIMS